MSDFFVVLLSVVLGGIVTPLVVCALADKWGWYK